MAKLKASLHNPAYLHSSVSILLFFASWGIWWSFFQLWLTKPALEGGLGMNGTEVGTVYSINSAFTLIIMLFYGTIQDRLGIKRHLAILVGIVATLIGPFANYVYRPLLQSSFMVGVIVGAVVLSAGFLAAAGLMEAISERMSRTHSFEYGQARMWGSFGYALVALAAGFLFVVNPALNFWVGSAFGVLLLLVQLLWKVPAPATSSADSSGNQPPSLKDMVATLKMPSLWTIIIFVIFSWTFYNLFDQQMFPDFYTNLFASKQRGEQVYGILNSVQVFAEAAMMGVVPLIMRKVGVRNSLLLGVGVMAIRICGCAIFTDPVVVSCVKMLHAIEVPLFILPIFRYFTLHFNPKLSATLYMVGFQVSAQIGSVILSAPMGALRDRIGYQPTFFVITAIVVAAGIYAFFLLKRDNQDVLGDPFTTDRQSKPASVATTSRSQNA